MFKSFTFKITGMPKPLIRHSRSKLKEGPSVTDRFKTQPIVIPSPESTSPIKDVSLTQSKSTANVLDRDEDGKYFIINCYIETFLFSFCIIISL